MTPFDALHVLAEETLQAIGPAVTRGGVLAAPLFERLIE
ncbi:MAG: hypothetical protein RL032_1268, partial [Pseudomonadota bacterium]